MKKKSKIQNNKKNKEYSFNVKITHNSVCQLVSTLQWIYVQNNYCKGRIKAKVGVYMYLLNLHKYKKSFYLKFTLIA